MTPQLQQQLAQNSGQALVPATQQAVGGVQGATQSGVGGIQGATSAGTAGITNASNVAASGVQNAAGAGAAGVMGATGAGVGGIQGATSSGVSGITGAGNSLTPDQLSQWENPWTQQVVDATQAQFNNQNKQQQAQVAGNAISQGAFGGDREGVAQALTAEQQQLTQAPVIAGLESQGYTTALQAAQQQAALKTQAETAAGSLGLQGASAASATGLQGATTAGQMGLQGATTAGQFGQQGATSAAGLGLQGNTSAAGLGLQGASTAGQMGMTGATTGSQLGLQGAQIGLGADEANAWLNSQAAFGEANLGGQAQSMGYQDANALLSAGNLEQQQAQSNLNVPYSQYTAQQAYPFQTTGWLANIAEGLGGASGGTSSTTSPAASTLSQVAGLGTGALGTLGVTGAFGNNGYLTGSNGLGSSISNMLGYGAGYTGLVDAGAGAGAAVNTGYLAGQGLSSAGTGLAPSAITSAAGGRIMQRGGMIPRRAVGGGFGAPAGVNSGIIDAGSPVPGADGMGAAPAGSGRTPYILGNYGSTSTTDTKSADSTLGSILKTAGAIAATAYGGPAGGMAANALGSVVHFNHGGMIPRRADGGSSEPKEVSVKVEQADPQVGSVDDQGEPWYAPLVQQNLSAQMAASLAQPDGAGMKSGGMLPLMPPEHFAAGGMSAGDESPWWERSEARAGDRHGLLTSPIAGRTDKLAVSPAAGSYVMPADVISGLGEGNTLSGANVMQHILDTGPHGIPLPKSAGGIRGLPHPPPAYHEGVGDDGMASGGVVGAFAAGGMSPAVTDYLSGNGLGGKGIPAGGTGTTVPFTGINTATGKGSSNTGNAALDNYLNTTQAGASYAKPKVFAPPAPPAAPAAGTDPATVAPDSNVMTPEQMAQAITASSVVGGGAQASGGRIARRAWGGGTGGSAADWTLGDDPSPVFGNTGMSGVNVIQNPPDIPAEEFGPPMPLDDTTLRQDEGGLGAGPPKIGGMGERNLATRGTTTTTPNGGMRGPPQPPGSGSSSAKGDHSPAGTDDYQKYLGLLHPMKADPWTALALAGFSMAAGKSPHALENIGAGAAKGMTNYIAQKQEESKEGLQAGETAEKMADTAAYREGMLNYHGAQTQNTADRNATYASQVATMNVVHQREVELKASGLDEKTAHDHALEDLGQGRLDAQIQHYGDMNQHYVRSDANTGTRNDIARDSLDVRRQALQNTEDYRTAQRELAQTRLTQAQQQAIITRSVTLAAATGKTVAQAKAQIMQEFPNAMTPPAGAGAPPPSGTGAPTFTFPP